MVMLWQLEYIKYIEYIEYISYTYIYTYIHKDVFAN